MSNLQSITWNSLMAEHNIIIIEQGDHIEGYGSLKKICDAHDDFSYQYLLKKATYYPFRYKGWNFYKVRFNKRHFYAKKL